MNKHGFTLVEIMVVVAIIALLAGISIPYLVRARTKARVSRVARDLKTFSDAFLMYSFDNGLFPQDSHMGLPPGMDTYIHIDNWSKDALGGTYNWEGPSWGEGGPYNYAGISVFNTTATTSELQLLDQTLDDGNLATGSFRLMPNGRYTYVIQEI